MRNSKTECINEIWHGCFLTFLCGTERYSIAINAHLDDFCLNVVYNWTGK